MIAAATEGRLNVEFRDDRLLSRFAQVAAEREFNHANNCRNLALTYWFLALLLFDQFSPHFEMINESSYNSGVEHIS